MKNNILFVLSLFFISSILIGCQLEDYTTKETDRDKVKTNQLSQKGEEISKVSISKAKGNETTVFTDDPSIETLNTIFISAVMENGIVNMSNPEFYIDVFYSDNSKQRFNLWIGKSGEKSTFMNADDTHTIYTVSKEMTDKINDLIN